MKLPIVLLASTLLLTSTAQASNEQLRDLKVQGCHSLANIAQYIMTARQNNEDMAELYKSFTIKEVKALVPAAVKWRLRRTQAEKWATTIQFKNNTFANCVR
tara:strand:- start:90 stop:395 length:306 start_codon:yes stop_codon:yes gene_type:complete